MKTQNNYSDFFFNFFLIIIGYVAVWNGYVKCGQKYEKKPYKISPRFHELT